MKISADFEGRDDEYDDETIRYYESLSSDDGYFYEVYVLIDGVTAAIIITDDGVSVDFKDSGESIHTNIVPKFLFGEQHSLTFAKIARIITILESTGTEGRKFSVLEMNSLYEQWKDKHGG